jgi:hypothetical protein
MISQRIHPIELPGPLFKVGIVLQWLTPSRPFCIAAVVLVSLWILVYCTATGKAIPDGTSVLVGLLLGINAAHSTLAARRGKKEGGPVPTAPAAPGGD